MTEADISGRVCPVVDFLFTPPPQPAGSGFQMMDGIAELARPVGRSREAGGYWVFTDHEVILDGLQRPDFWSSSVIIPTEPDPPYKWIPVMLDPPIHTRWRHLLGTYFTPKRVRDMQSGQRLLAVELIENLKGRGECDFVKEFAQTFPSVIFLDLMGMPRDKLAEFMEWEEMILHQNDVSDPDFTVRLAGMQKVGAYFAQLLAARRAQPDPGAQDIVSAAVQWEIDGAPVDDLDLLNCLLLLFMAGLDTVASQLSYSMWHLADHAEHRRRITAEPEIVPSAVEELLRAYPIVHTSRKAARDGDFSGCPVKAGDMAMFPLSAAGRDGTAYEAARDVNFDRGVTRHISFGAGPHRCLGSHLARQEMAIALREWHKLIPDYEVVGEPTEHRGGVWGIDSLTLRWAV